MKLIQGSALNPKQRQQVLSAFIYRWTTGNLQREYVYRNISKPTVPPITDDDWLSRHAFYVKANGEIAHRPGHCEPAYMANW